MITKISSGKNGQIRYHFDSGVVLSFIWDSGTYSDNNMKRLEDYKLANVHEWESTTVECMSMGEEDNGMSDYLTKQYGDNPAGYVPVSHIPRIIARADGLLK